MYVFQSIDWTRIEDIPLGVTWEIFCEVLWIEQPVNYSVIKLIVSLAALLSQAVDI